MPTPLVEILSENDPTLLEQDVIEDIRAHFEEWEPTASDLDYWLTKTYVRIASTLWGLASIVSRETLKTFGEAIVSVPPILATPATVNSTWTMVDDAGYTIPDGTLVAIPIAGDEKAAFQVVGAVTVAAESTATAEGAVILEAVEAGVLANGLSGAPSLIDGLAFVKSVALAGVTAGGVDAEEEDAYLERLVLEMQTLTRSAVIPRDYEILARRVPGVARATALDNYDAKEEEEGVPLVVSVAVADEDGAALSAGVKEEILVALEGRSLTNVKVFVIDATYTGVDVECEVTVLPGYDPAAVVAAVEARLTDYLSPANWGLPSTGDESSTGWVNQTTVYRNELISEVDRVAGVERVVTLELAVSGDEPKTQESISLEGVAPLAEPGEIEVSAA